MKRPSRKTVIKYAIATAVGVLLGWAYLASQASAYGPLADQTALDQLRLLCDAFCVPGLLLLMTGLLVTVSNEGALDAAGYLGHYLYHVLVPGKRASVQRYGDYVLTKRGKRVVGYGFLYVVGGVFMAVGLVLYLLFKVNS